MVRVRSPLVFAKTKLVDSDLDIFLPKSSAFSDAISWRLNLSDPSLVTLAWRNLRRDQFERPELAMNRCDSCRTLSNCPVCGGNVTGFHHVGVRGITKQFSIPIIDYNITYEQQASGIWHYSQGVSATMQSHRSRPAPTSTTLKFNGGPVWQDGHTWQSIYWGSFFAKPSSTQWISRIEQAVAHIETDQSYSGGLRQYNVGIGRVNGPVTIQQDPPSQLQNVEIAKTLTDWINSGTVTNFGAKGAYNIFLPPGTTASLASDQSCQTFCDYHDSVKGSDGPFYTVEPYPCTQGCNQCSNNPFDALTQGLSEEMVELKTDMDPGTGWVIGNEEICDYCDTNFVCNRISTGEYVNSWYDKSKNACWIGRR